MLKRKERIIPLIFINLSVIAGFLILLFMQSTRLFSTIYMIYLIVLVVLSIITIFWKISFHTSYVTIFSIVFVTIYGKWALFTIILIPLMIWARVELKRHTWAQTISGVIITGLISIAVLHLKGFNIPIRNLLKQQDFKRMSIYLNLNLFFNYINIVFIISSVSCFYWFASSQFKQKN